VYIGPKHVAKQRPYSEQLYKTFIKLPVITQKHLDHSDKLGRKSLKKFRTNFNLLVKLQVVLYTKSVKM